MTYQERIEIQTTWPLKVLKEGHASAHLFFPNTNQTIVRCCRRFNFTASSPLATCTASYKIQQSCSFLGLRAERPFEAVWWKPASTTLITWCSYQEEATIISTAASSSGLLWLTTTTASSAVCTTMLRRGWWWPWPRRNRCTLLLCRPPKYLLEEPRVHEASQQQKKLQRHQQKAPQRDLTKRS